MKEIKLTQGKVALVDDEDFDWLNTYKWAANERGGNWYAVTPIKINGKYKMIKMHRMILNLTDSKILCDHKDGNGLNNQRINLRPCSASDNSRNRRANKNSTSQYLGVSWKTAKRRWYAGIRHNNKHVYLGMSKDEKEAALMYNEGAKKYFGEFAKLNVV